MSDLTDTVNVAELVALLDLPEFETRAQLIWLLQERRGHQADALAAPTPPGLPTPSSVRLRMSQRREIEICEGALDRLGAPYVAPNFEED